MTDEPIITMQRYDAALARAHGEIEALRKIIAALQEWRACGCTGVHYADIDGEAEAEPCDLWIELDDRLRAYEAQQEQPDVT